MKLVRIDAYTTALVPDDDPRAAITPKPKPEPAKAEEPQPEQPEAVQAVKRVRKS